MSGGYSLAVAHGLPVAANTAGSPFGKHLLAPTTRKGGRGRSAGNPRDSNRGTRRTWKAGPRGVARRRHLYPGKKRGDEVGKTKVGKGMKLEVVVDHSGLPLGVELAAADVSEQELLMPALDDVPIELPPGTPGVAEKRNQSDLLRDELQDASYMP